MLKDSPRGQIPDPGRCWNGRALFFAMGLFWALGACAVGGSDSAPKGGSGPGEGRGTSNPGSGSGGAVPQDPSAPPPMTEPPPPETEEQRSFETPQAGARFVYVANPTRDSVAVIDSMGLGIKTVRVGDAPADVATAPGQDVAVVVNLGSRDVNVLRTDPAGQTTTTRLPVVAGVNRVAMAPDGRHAVVFFDTTRGSGVATANFQEVTLLTLAPGADQAIDMTVGFRPLEVVFAQDGSAAFVITEEGVSALRWQQITGPGVAPLYRLQGGAAAAAGTGDVSVTPDGRYAVSRQDGSGRLVLTDLASGTSLPLDLPGPVTDLDLAPAGDFALAVLREQNAYLRLPVPGGFADPTVASTVALPTPGLGSATVSPDGTRAVFYTTVASASAERLVIADLSGAMPAVTVPLKKGVRAVAIAPGSKTALVVHDRAEGDPAEPGIDIETQIDRAFGYTALNLETGFAKLELTPADVWAFALTPEGSRAFVVSRGPRVDTPVRLVQRLDLRSFIVDDFVLGSPPLAVAALGASVRRVFVSQAHPEGRITFIDWETGVAESVTGFELNGRIVQ